MSLLGCISQSANSTEVSIDFEEVNHFSYPLISESWLVLDTQKKIDSVYSIIHSQTQGSRLAPIPTMNEDESYLVFKPVLKNTNDIEIKKILLKNSILYIEVVEFSNPEILKLSRASPSVLVKLLTKVNVKNIIIKYQKNH